MKRLFSLTLVFLLLLGLCSCGKEKGTESYLDGVLISEYTIVYAEDASGYNKRAAEYLYDEILARTHHELSVVTDDAAPVAHEIVVGETTRDISAALSADATGVQLSMLARDGSVALEGEGFAIAAAAYYFIDTYVPEGDFDVTLPSGIIVREPIMKEAKSVILLIGDGMGVEQTRLFEYLSDTSDYSDGEDAFYGYRLPYHGFSRTDSLSGTTDSAAGGTALATGYKTYNGYVGLNANGDCVTSLVELFASLGKSTAVMSTETSTGATPATFSAHADSRSDAIEILEDQFALELAGTYINCGFDYYSKRYMESIENKVSDALDKMSENEKGFFLMYEEAHIDKHSHSNDMHKTFLALIRFNQVIGRFMEYAFYHPDTVVIITADHETGDLRSDGEGKNPTYHSEDHSSADVPVFAYGAGISCFDGVTVENVQIAKTIAKLVGVSDFGDPDLPPALN